MYRGYQSTYWTSGSLVRKFYYNNGTVGRQNSTAGESYNVRCIKDN
jgi:hypothetical protein